MGPVIVARALSGEATNAAQRRECCIARRLGASSPTTNVDAVTTTVTMAIPTGCAAPPRNWSWAVSGSASVTAAVAEARKPASVIPSWMVARNRFGSRARRTTSRSRCLPRRSSSRSCPSRSEMNAASLPANNPLTRTRNTTNARSNQYPSIARYPRTVILATPSSVLRRRLSRKCPPPVRPDRTRPHRCRIAASTSSAGSCLVQKNQSAHSTPSTPPVIRSSAVPHEPAGGTITASPGRQSAGVATSK